MSKLVVAYASVLATFLALDAVWLSVSANSLYRQTLGDILLPSFRIAPAAVFYPVFALGIVALAVAPAMNNGSWRTALEQGAMLGFFSYGLSILQTSPYYEIGRWPYR